MFEERVATDPRFWNQIGPFGGWLAARAFAAMARDLRPGWTPRSLQVQFLGPVAAGAFDIGVATVRQQRTLLARRAELRQGGAVAVTADAVFAAARADPVAHAPSAPAFAPAGRLPRWHGLHGLAAFVDAFDYRVAVGLPFTGSREAVSGGWLRLEGAGPPAWADLPLLADAWFPALWTCLDAPVPVTTVSWQLLFHDCDPPASAAGAPLHVAALHRCDAAAQGWGQERGELWWADGRLLLQSQQLVWIDARKAHARHGAAARAAS